MNLSHIQTLLTIIILACLASAAISQEPSDIIKSNTLPPNSIWLETLDLTTVMQPYRVAHASRSLRENPITINGVVYPHGIGTHARSEMAVDINGHATRFLAMCGVDDESPNHGTVTFEVWGDGKKLADTGLLEKGQDAKLVDVDLAGVNRLLLIVTDSGDDEDGDHADWAGAILYLKPGAPTSFRTLGTPDEPAMLIASTDFTRLGIHGPRIVGATPGRDFLFSIPATGKAPLTFSAKGLPEGLKLNSETGIISGSLNKAGEYVVTLSVKDSTDTFSRKLKIVGGEHKLALTPPLGWNSWNVWGTAISDAKTRAAADAMVNSGLASFGFQYVNIDDCWEGKRDSNGEIQSDENFPDMKALADYIHSKGLKIGIYSSPGKQTCACREGSYQHEQQDADTWAKWGIDYLKYDWCSYASIAKDKSREELQKPYRIMRQALDNCGRDIVYSLCQYGMGNVWEWGTEVGGNCWRTTGDISDNWSSLSGIAFNQNGHEKYAGPGHWNDPDMLIVGKLGWGPNLRPTKLKPNEQILHITLWSLLSSPLLIGCDMTDMDKFTIDLLTNEEVLDINQDPLGRPAGRMATGEQTEIWARPLWDGTIAVGLINRAVWRNEITVKWSDLGISGPQPIRDLWQKKDLGTYTKAFSIEVPAHGAVLVKIGKPNRTDW